MRAEVRKEIWNIKGKNRSIYVARDKKGRLESWRKVKGSKLTLKEAKDSFSQNRSFRKEIFKYKNGSVLEIQSIKSKLSRQKQVQAKVLWYDKKAKRLGETIGYSDFGLNNTANAKKQAFGRAKAGAVDNGWLKYSDVGNFEAKYEILYWKVI